VSTSQGITLNFGIELSGIIAESWAGLRVEFAFVGIIRTRLCRFSVCSLISRG